MRVVLYTHDVEPITILELSAWAYEFLRKHRTVRLPVVQAPRMCVLNAGSPPPDSEHSLCLVEITAETLRRNGETHMMLFTHHEEQALLLKAAFLPGQRHQLREQERKAFAEGFLYALSKIGE